VAETVVVAAGVIERDGRLLIARRQAGTHLEGYWEFPGGKCLPGETLAECLVRELREELDVEADPGEEMLETTHAYPERRVELHFLRCELRGTPSPQIGQEIRWVLPSELAGLAFPPADAELIALLASRTAAQPFPR